ncbi:MAG: hypothetical protein GC155_06160 [Alphaproteobacteria bacterium]|nr:hypothetical protein [Alphaproteobacteria bacterium]
MLVVIANERDMHEALRARRRALHITQEEAEHEVGLTRGHIGKIENCKQKWGKHVFRMTPTLEWLLEFYKLRIVVIDADDDRLPVLDHLTARMLHDLAVARRQARSHRCPETMDLFEELAA